MTGQCDLAANGAVVAEGGVTVTGSLVAGGKYERLQGFTPIWDPSWPAFTGVGPTFSTSARIEGRCELTTTTRVHLFDALGPEATATAYIRVDGHGAASGDGDVSGQGHVTAVGGIDARVSGSFRPFGVSIATITAPPFHKEWTLFDESVPR